MKMFGTALEMKCGKEEYIHIVEGTRTAVGPILGTFTSESSLETAHTSGFLIVRAHSILQTHPL